MKNGKKEFSISKLRKTINNIKNKKGFSISKGEMKQKNNNKQHK